METAATTQNNKFIFRFVISSIVPILCILFSIFALLGNMVLTKSFAIVFFINPCLILFLNYKLIKSIRLRKIAKIILCILLSSFFIFETLFLMGFVHYVEKNTWKSETAMENYESFAKNSSVLPSLSDLGDYKSVEHHHLYDTALVFFTSDTDYYIFRYDSEEYKQQKDRLKEKYHFQETPIQYEEFICEPQVTLGKYTFQLLSLDEKTYPELYYPESLFFIATNDKTNEIIYMYYDDIDLDYIDSTKQLILEDAGWKYIR